jgi:LPXTG-motif cell wall-anchored protein
VRTKHIPRRLLAGLAGLALGIGGAVALAAPAQAVDLPVPEFQDTCDGTYVQLPDAAGGEWSVTTGGDPYWPGEDDVQPGPAGAWVFVPADSGEIKVLYGTGEGDPAEIASRTWYEPRVCELIPGPVHTQPTCDMLGTITIPDLPEEPEEPPVMVLRELTTALEELPAIPEATGPIWLLDGEEVEDGSTHEVEPGTHVVELVVGDYTLKTWVIEMEEPTCPDDPGEGGELPKTGTSTAIIAIGAGLLVAVGAGLFVMARRRRITFTA